ncbi:hypothetical protein [Porphyromonas sp. COT-290 OH860]|uniref:hypothetical protein n=1 Tax=Porphyromonas sp. COT-290 OH860 TaxID=1515615 RepID=UPI001269E10C|nr:hypothetical protein [Porphyromonas sp. COT-290 OH860]
MLKNIPHIPIGNFGSCPAAVPSISNAVHHRPIALLLIILACIYLCRIAVPQVEQVESRMGKLIRPFVYFLVKEC